MKEKPFYPLWFFLFFTGVVAAGGFWLAMAVPMGVRWHASTAPEWLVFVYLVTGFAILPATAWASYALAKMASSQIDNL